ncbi:hypothetical protein [Planctomyces sp. SH-PL14]|uniref:hypothetical protein n=1 Tax=Planctomyces sp. SH-PL14 TaxID=1632864 RepID=UPI0012E9255C|nr:hypothetical protein [Planctomyces sp. SH-PL14]
MVPRRRTYAEEHFGAEVVRHLCVKGLIEQDGDLLSATRRGLIGLKADPPPSPVGVRVWFEPDVA